MRIVFVSLSRKRHVYFSKIARHAPQSVDVLLSSGRLFILSIFYFAFPLSGDLRTNLADAACIQLRRQQLNYPFWFGFRFLGWGSYCLSYIAEKCRLIQLRKYFIKHRIGDVVVWNGQKPPYSTVVLAAKSLGLKLWYFENGIAPNTTTLDPGGVNARSCLKSLSNEVLGLSLNSPMRSIRPSKPFTVLVPLQVESDTQLVVHATWVKSSCELVEEVVRALDSVCGYGEYRVIVRPHPKARRLVSIAEHPSLMVDGHTDLEVQLRSSNAVVTINSSVGFDAMRMGLPVCHLAPCIYGREGVSSHILSGAALKKALKAISTGAMCLPQARAFVDRVLSLYLIADDWREVDDASKVHFQAVWRRLLRKDPLISLLSKAKRYKHIEANKG